MKPKVYPRGCPKCGKDQYLVYDGEWFKKCKCGEKSKVLSSTIAEIESDKKCDL